MKNIFPNSVYPALILSIPLSQQRWQFSFNSNSSNSNLIQIQFFFEIQFILR